MTDKDAQAGIQITEPTAFREARHFGRLAYIQGMGKRNNPYYFIRFNPHGKRCYIAWRRGWEEEAYKAIKGRYP